MTNNNFNIGDIDLEFFEGCLAFAGSDTKSKTVSIDSIDFRRRTRLIRTLSQKRTDRRESFAKFLISKGADVNARDKQGKTPLHYASANGYKDIVVLLISERADIFTRDNWNNWTPLYFAAGSGHTDIVEILKEEQKQYGKDPYF